MTPMTFDDPFDRYRRDGGLRASDAEREQTADALRRHHSDGRLTDDEFEQRVGHCYQARTVGELDRLLVDLPSGDRDLLRHGVGGGRVLLAGAGRGLPLPALILGGVVALWVVGSILGALLTPFGGVGGWGHHHPGPPLFVPLLIAFFLWRWVARRRRASTKR
jgi:hypothetical protein